MSNAIFVFLSDLNKAFDLLSNLRTLLEVLSDLSMLTCPICPLEDALRAVPVGQLKLDGEISCSHGCGHGKSKQFYDRID